MSPAEDNDSFIRDIFCCILNALFKSKIWAKIDELGEERDHRNSFVLVLVKKKRNKESWDGSLLFYLVTPSFPAKKGNRTLSLSGTVKYYSGAVL